MPTEKKNQTGDSPRRAKRFLGAGLAAGKAPGLQDVDSGVVRLRGQRAMGHARGAGLALSLCVALLALLASAGVASANRVASWNLATGTIDSATPYPATGSDIDTEAGALSLAPALSPKIATNRFVAAGWGVNPFPEPDFYLEFTVAPLAGSEILFTSLEAKLASASGSHDLGYEVRSSVDCYASALDGGTVTIDGSESVALDLFAMSAQAGATTFRLYIRDIDTIGAEIGVSGISVFGQPVSGGTSPFVRVTPIDFCTAPESTFRDSFLLFVDGSHLYTSKTQPGIGGQLWRSPDRLSWEPIGPPGLGNADNEFIQIGTTSSGLVWFGGLVYAGTKNGATGGEIHRSSDLRSWTAVMMGGFGDPDNVGIAPRLVHDGYLYAAAHRSSATTGGAAIWRSADGISWDQTSPDGFGDSNNTSIHGMLSFGGAIYAATANLVTGAEIWRSFDGATWEKVVAGSEIQPGDPFVSIAEFDGYLYAGHWRSADGTTWGPVPFGAPPCNRPDPYILFVRSSGTRLFMVCPEAGPTGDVLEIWGSTNGTRWIRIADGGLGNPFNLITPPTEFQGHVVTSTLDLSGPPSNAAIWSATLPAFSVPSLSTLALGVLAAALGVIGARRLRSHERPTGRNRCRGPGQPRSSSRSEPLGQVPYFRI